MDRLDYFFRQKVTESELDQGFDNCELADRAILSDQSLFGRVGQGLDPTQTAPTPAVSVDVTGGAAYDRAGQRILVPQTETVSIALDSNGIATDVSTPGNTKIVSIFVEFERNVSDPRIDGNNNTVFFNRAEGFRFFVKQGAESAGVPTPPPLESGRVLLADVTRSFGQTQVVNAEISTARREDLIKVAAKAGTPALSETTINAAIDAVIDMIDSLVAGGGGGVSINASAIEKTGPAAWWNGFDPFPDPTDVSTFIDRIVSDLANDTSGQSGSERIGIRPGGTIDFGWTSTSIFAALDIVADEAQNLYDRLTSTSSPNDGASFVGAAANGPFSAGSVASQIAQLHVATGTPGAARIGARGTASFLQGTVETQLEQAVTGLRLSPTGDYYCVFCSTGNASVTGGDGSLSRPFRGLDSLRSFLNTLPVNARCKVFLMPGDYGAGTGGELNVTLKDGQRIEIESVVTAFGATFFNPTTIFVPLGRAIIHFKGIQFVNDFTVSAVNPAVTSASEIRFDRCLCTTTVQNSGVQGAGVLWVVDGDFDFCNFPDGSVPSSTSNGLMVSGITGVGRYNIVQVNRGYCLGTWNFRKASFNQCGLFAATLNCQTTVTPTDSRAFFTNCTVEGGAWNGLGGTFTCVVDGTTQWELRNGNGPTLTQIGITNRTNTNGAATI